MEEVEKNFSSLRGMLSGDGEAEPNADQAVQLALEFCKEDVISLVIHKLHILGWEVSQRFQFVSLCVCLIESVNESAE